MISTDEKTEESGDESHLSDSERSDEEKTDNNPMDGEYSTPLRSVKTEIVCNMHDMNVK